MSYRRSTMIATLTVALAMPVLAADPGVETRTVRVGRPTASSPAAIRRTERRIAEAALEACGSLPGSAAEMKAAIARSPCWRTSYAGGIAQLDGGARTSVALLPSPRSLGKP